MKVIMIAFEKVMLLPIALLSCISVTAREQTLNYDIL